MRPSTQIDIRALSGGDVRLTSRCVVPAPRPDVFEFFADAFNLERLTPDFLSFRVKTPRPIEMREGVRIDYALKLHGFPIRWRSEISRWDPPHAFVDQQLRGPYQTWHHTHCFHEVEGGTAVTDEVRYRAPGGRWVDRLIVRRDVYNIFAYRAGQLRKIFAPVGEPLNAVEKGAP